MGDSLSYLDNLLVIANSFPTRAHGIIVNYHGFGRYLDGKAKRSEIILFVWGSSDK